MKYIRIIKRCEITIKELLKSFTSFKLNNKETCYWQLTSEWPCEDNNDPRDVASVGMFDSVLILVGVVSCCLQ